MRIFLAIIKNFFGISTFNSVCEIRMLSALARLRSLKTIKKPGSEAGVNFFVMDFVIIRETLYKEPRGSLA